MDLTVEVMLPPRGASDYSSSANSTWRVLTPVAVYTLRQPASVGMQNTGYVHVTGIPVPQAWSGWTTEQIIGRINAILCQMWSDAGGAMVERRIWAGDATVLTTPVRNSLRTNRQITVTWTQFKPVLKHLVRNAALTDADLT